MTEKDEKKTNQDKKDREQPAAKSVGREREKSKEKGWFRDNVESILVAVCLALVIRFFAVEAFKIPTGSMAPTLLGLHKAVKCLECGWKFPVDNKLSRFEGEKCPNCLMPVDVWRTCPECGGDLTVLGLPWLGIYTPWVWCSSCPFRSTDGLNRGTRGGNRILVNKVIYKFSKPHRWDVIVFLYPRVELVCKNPACQAKTDEVCLVCGSTPSDRGTVGGPGACPACGAREASAKGPEGEFICPTCGSSHVKRVTKNFIKRLIGLPGEHLEIKHGDIYIDGKIARKPEDIQNALWRHVYDSRYVPKDDMVKNEIWKTSDGCWQLDGNRLAVDAEAADEPSMLALNRSITDEYGYSVARTANPVGDLRIACDVTPQSKKGFVCAEIVEDGVAYRMLLQVGKGQGESVLMRSGEIVARNSNFSLKPFESSRVALYNVDDTQGVLADGKRVLSAECPNGEGTPASTAMIGAVGCKAVFSNVLIQRDIYYTHGVDATFPLPDEKIPDGYFFAMGDNSPNSRDSRIWGRVPMKHLIGRAFLVFWPISGIHRIK
ncbi:MAG: hypothetical protein GXP25_18775 [Planctomycetes bacterium]|nr:hypothetical protein [Planctomycetota bacterium]